MSEIDCKIAAKKLFRWSGLKHRLVCWKRNNSISVPLSIWLNKMGSLHCTWHRWGAKKSRLKTKSQHNQHKYKANQIEPFFPYVNHKNAIMSAQVNESFRLQCFVLFCILKLAKHIDSVGICWSCFMKKFNNATSDHKLYRSGCCITRELCYHHNHSPRTEDSLEFTIQSTPFPALIRNLFGSKWLICVHIPIFALKFLCLHKYYFGSSAAMVSIQLQIFQGSWK